MAIGIGGGSAVLLHVLPIAPIPVGVHPVHSRGLWAEHIASKHHFAAGSSGSHEGLQRGVQE